ncbi:hypothetical protein APD31_17345 [Acinetobacter baumannii]|nr:hypothetical protein APD31_17345 [Acinetobacter baumannii]KQD96273.1 hypothetical protein APD32_05535 [Acinetobacter baumannii]
MVVERKRVDRPDIQNQHTRRCPPSALPQREGDGGFYTQIFPSEGANLMRCMYSGLSKPTGNVGQRDHNNHKFLIGQFNLNKIL